MPIEIFYSYAHEDEALRAELEKHLSLLVRTGIVTGWHDRRIAAGDDWRDQIDYHARSAKLILLLISPDFLASDYCYDVEMRLALERHSIHDAIVIPVILRPVDWSGAPFAHLQCLPRDGKALTLWPNRDEAFSNVAQGIREAIARLQSEALLDHRFDKPKAAVPQGRVLDAAIPSHILKDWATELQVLIRLPESIGLKGALLEDEEAEARPEDVLSKGFKITFPTRQDGGEEPLKAHLLITSPDFIPPGQEKQFFIYPDRDSEVISFFLTPVREGRLKVLIELHWEDAIRGARRLQTRCVAEATNLPADVKNNVVRVSLGAGSVNIPEIGSFTRIFQSPAHTDVNSTSRGPFPPVPVRSEPGEFTRMFEPRRAPENRPVDIDSASGDAQSASPPVTERYFEASVPESPSFRMANPPESVEPPPKCLPPPEASSDYTQMIVIPMPPGAPKSPPPAGSLGVPAELIPPGAASQPSRDPPGQPLYLPLILILSALFLAAAAVIMYSVLK